MRVHGTNFDINWSSFRQVVFVEGGGYYVSMVKHETIQDAINYAMTKDYPGMEFHII